MRILILGGDGMLGHETFRYLRGQHEVRVTLHRELAAYRPTRLFTDNNAYAGIDARNHAALAAAVADFRPEAVLNAIGIVKQRPDANEKLLSLEINAVLPHRLAALAAEVGARLVHISTDCVFSGRRGNYTETDVADAEDVYGRSKFLGEPEGQNALTLRTSMIGRELSNKRGLLEWFLAQRGAVPGYQRAIYSGFTTQELARIIERLLVEFPRASGLYHVSSEPISKYDLLRLIQAALDVPVQVMADLSCRCDRSLDSTRFRKEFRYAPPSWERMVQELAQAHEED